MANIISSNKFLEAGSHFGHQASRWNPKMAKYIYGKKNRVHIINLNVTVKKMEEAYRFVKSVSEKGGDILFVGTRRQDKDAVKEAARRVKGHYVTERWLGGTLTNFRTIKIRVSRLKEIEAMAKDGTFDALTKKEIIALEKEKEKLNKFLSGIRHMNRLPKVLFVTEPTVNKIAILEARKLRIPVVGICDTNNDPSDLDFVIPANDDAKKSVFLITTAIADAIAAGKGEPTLAVGNEKFVLPEDEKRERFNRGGFKPRGNRNFKPGGPRRDFKSNSPRPSTPRPATSNTSTTSAPAAKPEVKKEAPAKAAA